MENDEQNAVNNLLDAQLAWEMDGGHPAEGPLVQRAAMEEIQRYEARFNAGENFFLMRAIYQCSCHGLKMPDWVAAGFRQGFQKILSCNAKTLGEVFGDPYPKGKHLNALKKRRNLRFVVWLRVREILAYNPDTPINRELFKRVGQEVKPPVGCSEAEEMYYEAKKFWKDLLHRNR